MRCVLSVPKPPSNLDNPNIFTLPAGTSLERVYRRNFRANVFNPCKGSPTRFAPIRDTKGDCVPSLYAASTLRAAIHETIFHDIPEGSSRKTVPKTHIEGRAHSQLEVVRDLELVSLRRPDLMRWKVKRDSLIGMPPRYYSDTARWAEAIHHQFPDVKGLLWTSNRCDPDTAYLFFGDRVTPSDFLVANKRDGESDETFLADVRNEGMRSDIVIVV